MKAAKGLAPFAHHGDFLRQVRNVTTRFRDDGLLSQDEWRDIMRAATRSRTPRR